MKTKLKPHIQKIKGAKNYALYNLLTGDFYHVEPTDDLEQLKDSLKDAGLTFETDGVVPFKLKPNLTEYEKKVMLEELQIRINGSAENNCWERIKKGTLHGEMSYNTLEALKTAVGNIPIRRIRIEAERDEPEQILSILNGFQPREVIMICHNRINDKNRVTYETLCRDKDIRLDIREDDRKDMTKRIIDFETFFRNQVFNYCLCKKVAVDWNGDIKYCLWSPIVLGNVVDIADINNMIINGVFDDAWKATKDTINTCKDCEFRYTCNDCRINRRGETDLENKPYFCNYNPYTGR